MVHFSFDQSELLLHVSMLFVVRTASICLAATLTTFYIGPIISAVTLCYQDFSCKTCFYLSSCHPDCSACHSSHMKQACSLHSGASSVRSLRNDLLVAADSVTSAMSSLVKELNTGKYSDILKVLLKAKSKIEFKSV